MTNANKIIVMVIILLFPFSAFADAGLPTLALAWPAFWILLLPIIVIEAYVGVIKFKIPWGKALKIVGLANLFSTLAGIPLAYLTAFVANLLCISPIIVAEHFSPHFVEAHPMLASILSSTSYLTMIGGEMYWQGLYIGAIVMCLPYGLISYYLELIIIRKKLDPDQTHIAHTWAMYANLISYTGIVVIVLFLFMLTGFKY